MAKIRKSAVDYATVREVAISFKAGGRLLACKAIHRSAEPESLVVRVGNGERDRMISTAPEIYYLTPHYVNSEAVLVRMGAIDRKGLLGLFEVARQFVTVKTRQRPQAAEAQSSTIRIPVSVRTGLKLPP